jgi:hypothetical protein
LLLTGGPDLAREFWLGHPMESCEAPLAGADLFEYLWREHSLSPLDYQLRVLDSVEAFCLHHDMEFLPFLRGTVFRLHKGTSLSAKESLSIMGKLLFEFIRTRNMHQTILEVMEPTIRMVAPSLLTRLVRISRTKERNEGWLLHAPDPSCSQRYPGYDAESWLGIQLERSPLALGGAPFDPVDCFCDVREISHVLESVHKGLHPVRVEDGWSVDGQPISRTVSFHQWVRRQGLDSTVFPEIPDHPVQEVLADVECPARRRRVLRSGAVYGSLCYILRITWPDHPSRSLEDGLSDLIGEAMGDVANSPLALAAQRHEELLRQFRQKLSFVYHRQDSTISCNGEHLLRGVPAKILQKVLMAYTLTGRTIFEHREFRRDPDLGLDPLNPNLESRIRIVSERLENRVAGLRIAKDERGRFGLEAKSLVEFVEE